MKHDQSPPVVLASDQPSALADLRRRFIEAGVRHPLVSLTSDSEVRDYFSAVCLAESLLPRLMPCLLFLDFKLPSLTQLIGWLKAQTVLEKLKIVVFGGEEGEPAKRMADSSAVEFAGQFPSLALLADLVARAGSNLG